MKEYECGASALVPLGKLGDPFEITLWVPSFHTHVTVVPAATITAIGSLRDPPAVNMSTPTCVPVRMTAPTALNENEAPEMLPTNAFAVCSPDVAPSVQIELAVPSDPVFTCVGETEPTEDCQTTDC